MRLDTVDVEAEAAWEAWNATRIQAVYRGYYVRTKLLPVRKEEALEEAARSAHVAAATIQKRYRAYLRTREAARAMAPDEAASRISRWYRGRLYRKMYEVLRGMLVGREAEEPSELLRTSVPGEAQVAGDAAAGVHVRLRLGGADWPPRIYFKVFTHRPVVDLGGYAPRDYTREVGRGTLGVGREVPAVRNLHASCRRASEREHDADASGRPGWYVREDRNGWRVLGGGLDMLYGKPSSRMDYAVPAPKERLGEAARRRKQRKVEWMKKMYASAKAEGVAGADHGSLGMGAGMTATATLRREVLAALGGLTTDEDLMEAIRLNSEAGGHPGDADDVESMTRWASLLDFDAYMASWSAQATSVGYDYVHRQVSPDGGDSGGGSSSRGDALDPRTWAMPSSPLGFAAAGALGLSTS